MYQLLQRMFYQKNEWTLVDEGIGVGELTYSHLNKLWGEERRYIVVRQEIKSVPKPQASN